MMDGESADTVVRNLEEVEGIDGSERCVHILFSGQLIETQGQVGTVLLSKLSAIHDLVVLDLGSCGLCDDYCIAMCKSLMKTSSSLLRELRLGGNRLSDESMSSIASVMRKNKILSVLVLRYNLITDTGVRLLCKGITDKSALEELSLASNLMSDTGCGILASTLSSSVPPLRRFDISGNLLQECSAVVLARDVIPTCNFLETLDLSWNAIGSGGARAIGRALENVNSCLLKELFVSGCEVGDEGALSIMHGAMKSSMFVDLSSNGISNEGGMRIVEIVRGISHSGHLTLDLGLNGIDPKVCEEIGASTSHDKSEVYTPSVSVKLGVDSFRRLREDSPEKKDHDSRFVSSGPMKFNLDAGDVNRDSPSLRRGDRKQDETLGNVVMPQDESNTFLLDEINSLRVSPIDIDERNEVDSKDDAVGNRKTGSAEYEKKLYAIFSPPMKISRHMKNFRKRREAIKRDVMKAKSVRKSSQAFPGKVDSSRSASSPKLVDVISKAQEMSSASPKDRKEDVRLPSEVGRKGEKDRRIAESPKISESRVPRKESVKSENRTSEVVIQATEEPIHRESPVVPSSQPESVDEEKCSDHVDSPGVLVSRERKESETRKNVRKVEVQTTNISDGNSVESAAADIAAIIGEREQWASLSSEEANMFALWEVKENRSYIYVPKYTTSAPLPTDFPDEVQVSFGFGENRRLSEYRCPLSSTIEMLLKEVIREMNMPGSADEYILKAVGSAEYLYGDDTLFSYDFVRKCMKKGKPISFALLPKKETLEALTEQKPWVVPHERNTTFEEETFDKSAMHTPFRVRVKSCKRLNPTAFHMDRLARNRRADMANLSLCCTLGLFMGGTLLAPMLKTNYVSLSTDAAFGDSLTFGLSIADISSTTKLCVTLWAILDKQKTRFWKHVDQNTGDMVKEDGPVGPVGCITVQLVDFKGRLIDGSRNYKLWPDEEANPIGTVHEFPGSNSGRMQLQFDAFSKPVVFQQSTRKDSVPTSLADIRTPSDVDKRRLEVIVKRDPLYEMTTEEKELVWEYRTYLMTFPKALPKFIQSAKVTDGRLWDEMHAFLHRWAPLEPMDAIELLDAKFSDQTIRRYAVAQLDKLSDQELVDILLQLTQVLKYEPYHDSPLARFLVRRALMNTHEVGHFFFWHLKAEMHVPTIRERYGLILSEYVAHCVMSQRKLVLVQNNLLKMLTSVAEKVKEVPKMERKSILHELLKDVASKLPEKLCLPLEPRMEVKGLIIPKCKTMDSKKVPLWLVFENADPRGSPIFVIFKAGDDLRQDLLTLQLLRVMDKLWQSEGLDFRMNPYGCIATGDEEGMIEIVLDSDTTANITRTISGGAMGAFKKETFEIWLRDHNPSDAEYADSVDNFVLSCAGYCVATYVLGIGDRHNDNVMVTKSGQLFHIDFGHFLGNIKRKFGVKRERAPFVFTPDFAHVMGGRRSPKFKEFVQLCGKAFNVLRRNADLFINLFALMLSTGIPELRRKSDIFYLRNVLQLQMTERQAERHFERLILKSLNSKATRFNNMVHILAH